MAKEVATSKKNEIAASTADLDYGADAGVGFEGTKGSDLSIPFLGVLQSNSPQVEDDSSGAKAGQLINTVTGELIDGAKGVTFLPVHKEQAFVEWIPRDKGGGFVAMHAFDSDVVKAAKQAAGGARTGKLVLSNGNELIETYYVYGLMLNSEGTASEGFGVISFSSTKIKPYRDWTTSMFTLKGRPPMFANRGVIKTIKQKNEKGSYFNFKIEPLKATWKDSLIHPVAERELLEEAKGFRDMVISGMARANFEQQNATGDSGNGNPEDAPF
jgi:hypothetical protein